MCKLRECRRKLTSISWMGVSGKNPALEGEGEDEEDSDPLVRSLVMVVGGVHSSFLEKEKEEDIRYPLVMTSTFRFTKNRFGQEKEEREEG
ncbi:hypothetical protein P7K49_000940, partial [Saguinus oedipus]